MKRTPILLVINSERFVGQRLNAIWNWSMAPEVFLTRTSFHALIALGLSGRTVGSSWTKRKKTSPGNTKRNTRRNDRVRRDLTYISYLADSFRKAELHHDTVNIAPTFFSVRILISAHWQDGGKGKAKVRCPHVHIVCNPVAVIAQSQHART